MCKGDINIGYNRITESNVIIDNVKRLYGKIDYVKIWDMPFSDYLIQK